MKGKNLKLLLFIALLSILILPQNTITNSEPLIADNSRENDSLIDVSLPERNTNSYNSLPSVSPESPSMITIPSMSDVGSVSTLLRGSTLTISGTLEDAAQTAWSGETIYIYFTNFHVSEGIGNGYIDNSITHLPPSERFDLDEPLMTPFLAGTAVTGLDGTYSLGVAIPNSLEPGIYEIFAWFNGSITDQSRLPSPLDPESHTVEIYGTIEIALDVNPLSIFIGGSTTATVTLTFDNGTGISPITTNDVIIDHTHVRTNDSYTVHDNPTISLGGTDTASLLIVEQADGVGTIDIFAEYTWASLEYQYFYSDVGGTQKSLTTTTQTVQITSDTTFTLSWADGTKIQPDSYRDVTWNINGTVINGLGPTPRAGVTIDMEVTQGATDLTGLIPISSSSTVTDAFGAYSFWFRLDHNFITDITAGKIRVTVILDTTAFPGDTYIPGTTLFMDIRLMANVTALNVDPAGTDTTIFYSPGDTFDISGTVNDTFGFTANLVPLEFYYGSIPAAYATGTSSNGIYAFNNQAVPDVAAEQTKTLFVKAVGIIDTNYIYVVGAVNDFLSIDTCFTLTVEYVYNDGTEISFTDPSFPTLLFNDSFMSFFAENVSLRIRDQWGRTPIGIPFKLDFAKVTGSSYSVNVFTQVVTVGNDGEWTTDIAAALNLPDLELDEETRTYSLVLTVGNTPDTTYVYTTETTNTFQSYGPDRTAPEITTVPPSTNPSITSTIDQKQNVSISVQANDPGTSATGIRFVILYYQLSPDESSWGSIIEVNITIEIDGFWTGWINTSSGGDDAVYVQFWLVAYDYAGYGFNTSTGLRFPVAKYAADYALSSANTSVYSYYKGDWLAPEVNDGAAQTNGTSPGTFNGSSTYITTQGSEINISVSVSDDLTLGSGVTQVTLNYGIRLINPETGLVIGTGEWSNFSQLMSSSDGNTWWSVITIDEWNYEYIYWFTATDDAGNVEVTDEYVNPSFFVLDLSVPDITADFVVPINITDTRYPWENETVQINFEITDTGSGLNETALAINMVFYYTYTLYTVTLNNGTVVQVTSYDDLDVNYGISIETTITTVELTPILNSYNFSGGIYTYNYTVFISTSLSDNTEITWWVNCTDLGANERSYSSTYQIKAYPITEPVEPIVPDGTGIDTSDEGRDKQKSYLVYGMIITFAVIGALFLYYQRSIIMGSIKAKQMEAKLRSFIDELLEEIRQHSAKKEYREAVHKIYTALEEVGRIMIKRPRYQFETAQEYAVALADFMTVDLESVMTITYKFEKARYGSDEITYDDFIEAETAFNVIIQTLLSIGAIRTTTLTEEESTPYPPESPPPGSNDPENK